MYLAMVAMQDYQGWPTDVHKAGGEQGGKKYCVLDTYEYVVVILVAKAMLGSIVNPSVSMVVVNSLDRLQYVWWVFLFRGICDNSKESRGVECSAPWMCDIGQLH